MPTVQTTTDRSAVLSRQDSGVQDGEAGKGRGRSRRDGEGERRRRCSFPYTTRACAAGPACRRGPRARPGDPRRQTATRCTKLATTTVHPHPRSLSGAAPPPPARYAAPARLRGRARHRVAATGHRAGPSASSAYLGASTGGTLRTGRCDPQTVLAGSPRTSTHTRDIESPPDAQQLGCPASHVPEENPHETQTRARTDLGRSGAGRYSLPRHRPATSKTFS